MLGGAGGLKILYGPRIKSRWLQVEVEVELGCDNEYSLSSINKL